MIAFKSSESKADLDVLDRSRASAFGIIGATPKARTRTHTAARKPLFHQRVANGTVRNCLRQVGISCGFLRLAPGPCGTDYVGESALQFQPEPIQWYPNDQNENGANDDYRFDFPK